MQLRIQTEPEMNISPLRLLVNRTIRTLCPALLMLPVACSESGLTIRVIDPLTNVLPGIVYPPAGDDTVRVARGENAVLQFVISADDSVAAMTPVLRSLKTEQGTSLDKAVLGWVRNVQASHAYVPAAPDALQSPSGEYPDPILTDTTVSIAAGGTALLWLDIPIPADAEAGLYEGSVRISGLKNGKRIVADRQFTIQVYPVTLPEQSLLVTNWYFPDKFSFMNLEFNL